LTLRKTLADNDSKLSVSHHTKPFDSKANTFDKVSHVTFEVGSAGINTNGYLRFRRHLV